MAIDDFGSTSPSATRWREMGVDVVKIDPSFIRALPDEHAAEQIHSFVRFGERLDVAILAEGIETEDQWNFLVQAGCLLGQGYRFSRPVPSGEITARCLQDGFHTLHQPVPA